MNKSIGDIEVEIDEAIIIINANILLGTYYESIINEFENYPRSIPISMIPDSISVIDYLKALKIRKYNIPYWKFVSRQYLYVIKSNYTRIKNEFMSGCFP